MQNRDQHSALRDLKNKSLRFIRLNGADKPKGEVAISELIAALNLTESEYKSVYAMLHNDQFARTNGMNSHIFLTELGREAADNLDSLPEPPGGR